MGKKNQDGQWYKVTDAVIGDESREMGQANGRPVVLRANLRDQNGQPVLMVVSCPMEDVPFPALDGLRRALTAQNLTPILMVPPEVRFLRLEPVSDVEMRRLSDEIRAEQEAEKEPKRIVAP